MNDHECVLSLIQSDCFPQLTIDQVKSAFDGLSDDDLLEILENNIKD